MWLFALTLSTLTAIASAGTCTAIDASDILAVPPPAVIVLGERPGDSLDGKRAARLVHRLSAAGPVTLALEALPVAAQPTLDQYAAGDIETERLADRLDWQNTVAFPYRPYAGLVTAAVDGVHVVAASAPPETPPADAQIALAPGYLSVLRDGLGGHDLPLPLEARYARTAAWRDVRIATAGITAWDDRGYLVIVTHRARVEGGFGVPWQASLLTRAPVHAFTLAWGGDPPCYSGDRVWRETLMERLLGG